MKFEEYQAEALVLAEAKKMYHVGTSPLTDAEYDLREDELRRVEAQHPDWVVSDSPTQDIGPPPEHGTKHKVPMESLRKVTTEEEQERFMRDLPAGTEMLFQKKADGVSMSLEYAQGVLVRALTRGDGREGEDVTDKVRRLSSVPNELPEPLTALVRGELVIHVDELSAKYKNARNAVAGALAASDTTLAAKENVRFYAFDMIEVS